MTLKGGCACRTIRYELTADPLIVHACHCRDCQRVTGSAFVVNIWIEQRFVRAGRTAPRPDVHIFTRSKVPWLALPEGVPAFEAIYKIDRVWSAASRDRLRRDVAGHASA